MRCGYCNKTVRDKWLLGTMHVCVPEERRAYIRSQYSLAMNQLANQQALTQPYTNPFMAPFRPWRDMPDLG